MLFYQLLQLDFSRNWLYYCSPISRIKLFEKHFDNQVHPKEPLGYPIVWNVKPFRYLTYPSVQFIEKIRKTTIFNLLVWYSRCLAINLLKSFFLPHTELKKKYNRNEERVKDLLDELKRLEIRVGSSRNKLQTLSACHSTCNAYILGNICEEKLKEEETKEKNRLDAHDSRVKSRQQANSDSA